MGIPEEETQVLKRVSVFVLLAAAAIAAGVSFASDTSSNQVSAISRFREVEISHVDFGDFAGAAETWQTQVKLLHRNTNAGYGYFTCGQVRNDRGPQRCSGTYILPEGEVDVAGVLHDGNRGQFVFVVTGTSGVYAGKSGTMSVSRYATRPRQAFVTFYFVG
jgi:hypothetical protein